MRAALKGRTPLDVTEMPRPGTAPLRVRRVPTPAPRPAWMGHPRLRRSSAITQYAVGAALEAIGADAARVEREGLRLGVVLCVMTGCVAYSRRFYDETLSDPATASPLVFPETVFNAPASHLAAVLNARDLNYTLVGDPSAFLSGLALGADWLMDNLVDGVVVIGAEETDWATAEALRLFSRRVVLADGAGAVYLRREPGAAAGDVTMACVTDLHLSLDRASQALAVRRVRDQLGLGAGELLCDGTQGVSRFDAAERQTWSDWDGGHLAPKRVLGEGLMAAAAWQCVSAIDAVQLELYPAAGVSVPGCNHASAGARFVRGGG